MQIMILTASRAIEYLLTEVVASEFGSPRLSVHAEARTALSEMRRTPADLALLGTQIEDLDALDFIPEILRARLARRLVVMLRRKDTRTLFLLNRMAVGALVDVDATDVADLRSAIQGAVTGRRYVSPSVAAVLRKKPADFNPNYLTAQEEKVLCLLAEGLDNNEAAALLGISSETIRTHRARIMSKLELHSKDHLVLYAIAQSYVRLTPAGILHPGLDHVLPTRLRPTAPCQVVA